MTGTTWILLDLLTAAAVSVAEDGRLDAVVAERLGHCLGLDAAIVVPVPARAHPYVSAQWQPGAPDELLARHVTVCAARLVAESAQGGLCRTGTWTDGSILYAVVRPIRSASWPGVPRVIASVRPIPFGADDLSLWSDAEEPLGALFLRADRDATAGSEGGAGPDLKAGRVGITERERDVLELLARGFTAMAIASRLDVSPRTVHRHLDNAYRKLGVHDRLLAVSAARRHGLICAPEPEEALG